MVWGKLGVCRGYGCLVAGLLGCGSSVQSSAPMPSGDILLGSDLGQYRTIYDAVEALRSNWLSGHAAMACRCEPVVYINGTKVRGVDVLRSTSPMAGVVVRHLSARQAAARYGHGHEGGAILVEALRLLFRYSAPGGPQTLIATSIPSLRGTIDGIQRLSE